MSSFSPIDLQIDLTDELGAPVTLALLLRDNGLGLAQAHAVVTELAANRVVTVTVRPRSPDDLLARLRSLGLLVVVQSRARAL